MITGQSRNKDNKWKGLEVFFLPICNTNWKTSAAILFRVDSNHVEPILCSEKAPLAITRITFQPGC